MRGRAGPSPDSVALAFILQTNPWFYFLQICVIPEFLVAFVATGAGKGSQEVMNLLREAY